LLTIYVKDFPKATVSL